MASLDAFLADLDELQDEEEEAQLDEDEGGVGDDDDDLDMMRDGPGESRGSGALLSSAKMTRLMVQIEKDGKTLAAGAAGGAVVDAGAAGSSDEIYAAEEAEYDLIVSWRLRLSLFFLPIDFPF